MSAWTHQEMFMELQAIRLIINTALSHVRTLSTNVGLKWDLTIVHKNFAAKFSNDSLIFPFPSILEALVPNSVIF